MDAKNGYIYIISWLTLLTNAISSKKIFLTSTLRRQMGKNSMGFEKGHETETWNEAKQDYRINWWNEVMHSCVESTQCWHKHAAAQEEPFYLLTLKHFQEPKQMQEFFLSAGKSIWKRAVKICCNWDYCMCWEHFVHISNHLECGHINTHSFCVESTLACTLPQCKCQSTQRTAQRRPNTTYRGMYYLEKVNCLKIKKGDPKKTTWGSTCYYIL